jgi:hypothetical protein
LNAANNAFLLRESATRLRLQHNECARHLLGSVAAIIKLPAAILLLPPCERPTVDVGLLASQVLFRVASLFEPSSALISKLALDRQLVQIDIDSADLMIGAIGENHSSRMIKFARIAGRGHASGWTAQTSALMCEIFV